MKLGDVLKKEREGRGFSHVEMSAEEMAEKLGVPTDEYEQIEAGDSPAERWGPVLAHIAVALETPTSRLLAESGRSEDTKKGQAGTLIKQHRERREQTVEQMVERMKEESEGRVEVTAEEYAEIEAGTSPIEKYGPLLLHFAEVIEQPVFNLFYPCGLPFQELDDYP